jgi:hypothetical protein
VESAFYFGPSVLDDQRRRCKAYLGGSLLLLRHLLLLALAFTLDFTFSSFAFRTILGLDFRLALALDVLARRRRRRGSRGGGGRFPIEEGVLVRFGKGSERLDGGAFDLLHVYEDAGISGQPSGFWEDPDRRRTSTANKAS